MKADIVILTVVPPELDAARRALRISSRPHGKTDNGTNYWLGKIKSKRDRKTRTIFLAAVGSAGNPDSAAASTEAIQLCRPQCVILLGIAAGIRKKLKIGEVVLSDRVIPYEGAAIEKNARYIPRPDGAQAEHTILQDVNYYLSQFKSSSLEKSFNRVHGPFPSSSDKHKANFEKHVASSMLVRSSTIASGEKLLRDPTRLHQWRETLHGKIEAGEMEAAGLVKACRRAGLPWLVVRGISDFGDSFKDDRFHRFASSSAAVVLADFLRTALSISPSPDRGPLHPDRESNDDSNKGMRVAASGGGQKQSIEACVFESSLRTKQQNRHWWHKPQGRC